METASVPAGPPHPLNTVFFNDRGLRAGWRLVIFITLIFGLLFVGLRLLFFVLSSVFHRPPPTTGVLMPEIQIVGDAVAFALMLLAAFIMSRIERRNMGVYGLPLRGEPVVRRFAVGYVFWGFLPLTICLVVIHLFHGYDFGPLALHGAQIVRFGIEWAIGFTLVGLTEEFLLRGYALYTLADGIGFWPAAIVLAAVFGIGHSFNPGETRVGLAATVVFALFASVTLRYTGNLWLAVGAHAGWDWGQTFFYGVNDSGMQGFGHLLQPSFHGPIWLTGGTVGPEGSAMTLILWTVMSMLVVFVYGRRKAALVLEIDKKS